jgi:PAS domain S-box-containing protein
VTTILGRLLLIVMVALTPVLLLQVEDEIQARHTRQQLMEDEAIRLVRDVANVQEQIIEGAEQVLTAMGSAAFVVAHHPEICQRLLVNLVSESPRYISASISAADGHFLCRPGAYNPTINLSDRAYFRLAMQTGEFAVGEYVVGRNSGQPTIHLAKPFKDDAGTIDSVAEVSLDLGWLAAQLARLPLPPGASVSILDRNGVLLARYPAIEGTIGRPASPDRKIMLSASTIKVASYRSLDGRERLGAFSPANVGAKGFAVVVGLDKETSFAAVTEVDEQDLVLLVLAFILALAATTMLGTQFIRKPVRRLLAVADRWRAGDLTARTEMRASPTEFGRLAAAFDAMAATLQVREAALRDSEEEYRAIFEQAAVGISQTTLDGTYVRVNDAMCAISARTRDGFLGHTIAEFTHPDDRAADRDQMATLIAGERQSMTAEKRWLRPDGSVIWLSRWTSLLRDHAGRPARFIAIIVDISARKAAEVALQESETRLRLAREAAGFGVWDWHFGSRTAVWSDQQWRFRGLEPGSHRVDQETWSKSIHPEDRERVRTSFAATVADPSRPYDETYRIIRPDGAIRWLHVKADAVADQQGHAERIVGLTMDVTETYEREAALRRLTTELQALVQHEVKAREAAQLRAAHAERMQALGQLAGGIAHDFNNVLQMVLSASTLIEDDPGNEAQTRDLAQLITEAAERGSATTSRLLSVGRHGSLRAEAVEASALLNGLQAIFIHSLGSNIKVTVQVDETLPKLIADRGQLEASLINLAANARDAMPRGGQLRLLATLETVDGDSLGHPDGLNPGRYVTVTVSDTGTGMDAATLANVGRPFFTTKPAGAGTGLGVAMARSLAERSGGALMIASQLGEGTTVTLWLPAMDAASAPDGPTSPAGASLREAAPAARILLVDDEAAVRRGLTLILSRSGFAVTAAVSGAEALEIFDSGSPVDLLLTDLSMPGMDGISLIKAAQERSPGLPAILLTGYADRDVNLAIEGATSGAYSLLRKPVRGRHLADRIRNLLAGAVGAG